MGAICGCSTCTTVDALGVTGMASAFKDAAGCGSLDLAATPVDGGYRLSGTLRWASNLYPDSVMVTAARLDSGEKIVVALPLAAPGVTIGDHFDLLALGSTASSTVALDDVYISTVKSSAATSDPFWRRSVRRFWCCSPRCASVWHAVVSTRRQPA